MHKRSLGVILFFIMLATAIPGWGQTPLAPGQVDWLNGVIQTTGIAYPRKKDPATPRNPFKMRSVAKVSAQKQLLKKVKQLRVSSSERVGSRVGADPAFMAKIQALIKNAPVIKQTYLSDGTLRITIAFKLWGPFAQLVLPPEIRQIETIMPMRSAVEDNRTISEKSVWTGLIVDARGVGLNPALVPTILDNRGGRVYGPEFITRDFAVQWGMCGYTAHLDDALASGRVGPHPLTVKGVRATGHENTDIVISLAAANQIRAAAEHVIILREGRVIVVTD